MLHTAEIDLWDYLVILSTVFLFILFEFKFTDFLSS